MAQVVRLIAGLFRLRDQPGTNQQVVRSGRLIDSAYLLICFWNYFFFLRFLDGFDLDNETFRPEL